MGKRKCRRLYEKRSRRRTGVFQGNQFAAAPPPDDDRDEIVETEEEVEIDKAVDSSFLKLHGLPFVFDDSSDSSDVSDKGEEDGSSDSSECGGNRIISLAALQELIGMSCVCARCKKGTLVMGEEQRLGLAPTVNLTCNGCGFSVFKTLGDRRSCGRSHFFYINRKVVPAMRLTGCGLRSLKMLCAILDMPRPMSNHTYECHRKALHTAAKIVCSASMKRAAAAVMARMQSEDAPQPDEIAVSTDGTWMRRGHSSLYGLQTVISFDTRQVLDVEILSKFCSQCSAWNAKRQKGEITAEKHAEWKATHQAACSVNTTSSAPGMECEAVLKLWM